MLQSASLAFLILAGTAIAGTTASNCGAKSVVCTTPFANSYPLCNFNPKVNTEYQYSCGAACNSNYLWDPKGLQCVQASINSCGSTSNKCTTPFANSYATCSYDGTTFTCGAACNDQYVWNPKTFVCDSVAGGSATTDCGTQHLDCNKGFSKPFAFPNCGTNGPGNSNICGFDCESGYLLNDNTYNCEFNRG